MDIGARFGLAPFILTCYCVGVMVAVWLSIVPHASLMRTQNSCVELIGGVVKLAEFAFAIGVLVNPACPEYH